MAEVLRNRHKVRTKQVEVLRLGLYTFIDDNTDADEQEFTDEDIIDVEAEDFSEWEDEDGEDYYASAGNSGINPLWVLFNGKIIWSASRYGFKLGPKEYFRRRLQLLLNFLADEFPAKSYEELLCSLQGFFIRDNNTSDNSGAWLEYLKNSGILYGDDALVKDKILPLNFFRAGKGEGKSGTYAVSLPVGLEHLVLEREILRRSPNEKKPLAWKNCKSWILESLNDFCDKINDFTLIFEQDNDDEEGRNSRTLGLRRVEFTYNEAALQRKMLKGWVQWWEKR